VKDLARSLESLLQMILEVEFSNSHILRDLREPTDKESVAQKGKFILSLLLFLFLTTFTPFATFVTFTTFLLRFLFLLLLRLRFRLLWLLRFGLLRFTFLLLFCLFFFFQLVFLVSFQLVLVFLLWFLYQSFLLCLDPSCLSRPWLLQIEHETRIVSLQ